MTAGWVKQGGAVLAFDCVIYLDFFLDEAKKVLS